ncbi:TPA: Shufflon protein B, partial [Salmonella enterica]
CQSAAWRSPVADGVYTSLGSFKGTYNGSNTTGKTMKIYARGGNPPDRTIDAGDADNCANTFSLVATVGGQVVANSTDNNSNWGKSGNIVFDVPAGSAFSVTSAGMVNYGCDYGTFSMLQYQ